MNAQKSITDQLRDLILIANEHGLYDASDYIRSMVSNTQDYYIIPKSDNPEKHVEIVNKICNTDMFDEDDAITLKWRADKV